MKRIDWSELVIKRYISPAHSAKIEIHIFPRCLYKTPYFEFVARKSQCELYIYINITLYFLFINFYPFDCVVILFLFFIHVIYVQNYFFNCVEDILKKKRDRNISINIMHILYLQ